MQLRDPRKEKIVSMRCSNCEWVYSTPYSDKWYCMKCKWKEWCLVDHLPMMSDTDALSYYNIEELLWQDFFYIIKNFNHQGVYFIARNMKTLDNRLRWVKAWYWMTRVFNNFPEVLVSIRNKDLVLWSDAERILIECYSGEFRGSHKTLSIE